MGEDFGVCVRLELVASGEKFFFQRVIILDDAVVNDRDPLCLIKVGMAISIGRNAVSGPARVADAQIAGNWVGLQNGGEATIDATGFFAQDKVGVLQDRHTGAVIAAIFQ